MKGWIQHCNYSPGPTLTMISTRLWENFSMTDSIQISGLTYRQRKKEFSEALGSTLTPCQGLDPALPGC